MSKQKFDELSSMQDILKVAIEREDSAHDFYLAAKARARTPVESNMFEKLAQQELQHKEALVKQLQEIQAQLDTDRALSYEVY